MIEGLLEKIGNALQTKRIPYMIVGGQAVLLHGEPRLTGDIDIVLGLHVAEQAKIESLARSLGFIPLVENVADFVNTTSVMPVHDKETGLRVDFIFAFSVYVRKALSRVRVLQIGTARVRFASLEDILVLKVIAGRPRDMEDALTMLIKNPRTDVDYIKARLDEFDQSLGEKYGEALEELIQDARS